MRYPLIKSDSLHRIFIYLVTCCLYLLIISSRAFWCSSRAARNSLFSCCSVRICLKVKIYCNHKYCVQSLLNSNLCNASKCGGGLDLSHVRAFANVCLACRLTHRDCFYHYQHFHIDIVTIYSFVVHFVNLKKKTELIFETVLK